MQKDLRSSDDVVIPFQVGDSSVRGRIVRLADSVDEILAAHQFDDAVSELLGEAACLVSMMGASLKFDGRLIFQAQGDGPAPLVVADYNTGGLLRAMASVTGSVKGRGPAALIGKGHIALTIDQGPDMDRYQGVTPIEGDTLADAAVAYFRQSEQIPTVVKLAVGKISAPGEAPRWRAGGIMAQYIPDEGGIDRERGEETPMSLVERDDWERAAAFLETTQADELLDPQIDSETLLYRLFHEDGVRVFEPTALRAECACNRDKIAVVLERYSREDLDEMAENGVIEVVCEFCRKSYTFDPETTAGAA